MADYIFDLVLWLCEGGVTRRVVQGCGWANRIFVRYGHVFMRVVRVVV